MILSVNGMSPGSKSVKAKFLKNMSACDCSQAPIPKDDAYQYDLENLSSSKHVFKYSC